MTDHDDEAVVAPQMDMVISVSTRHDVIIIDPQRFTAAARHAYQAANPDVTDEQAGQAVADVRDAAHALIDRYGALASAHPDVAGPPSSTGSRRRLHGGVGLHPDDRVTDRPDGLSPAGAITAINLNTPTLQSYGCSIPPHVDTLY